MNNLSTALIVTALGMGLVFAMIVMLWGLMALLVRLVAVPEPKESVKAIPETSFETARKRRAAVAAVATALIRESIAEPHEFPLPPTALVSAWQAVMRSEMLKKRGQKR
jgi:Na+-transporting methylmalonyl-CoA/oxaloacetate decarboxylase gamma subunit